MLLYNNCLFVIGGRGEPVIAINSIEYLCLDPPSDSPTISSNSPTEIPSIGPTQIPTEEPTEIPSIVPTQTPTKEPTEIPSIVPTQMPTKEPTDIPSIVPTQMPSKEPTDIPSIKPTQMPTKEPTDVPTYEPSYYPSNESSRTSSPTSIQKEKKEYSNIEIFIFFGTSILVCLVIAGSLFVCWKIYRKKRKKMLVNQVFTQTRGLDNANIMITSHFQFALDNNKMNEKNSNLNMDVSPEGTEMVHSTAEGFNSNQNLSPLAKFNEDKDFITRGQSIPEEENEDDSEELY